MADCEDPFTGFSSKVRDRLEAMSAASDCCLVSCEGEKHPVHKLKLVEQSIVLRGAVSELSAADELPLCEDAAGVRLLIEGMYNAYMAVTAGVVEPLLELSRKCDVEDIKLNCERFLNAVPLTLESLPRYMALACTFDIKSAVDRCKDYIDSDDHFVLLKGKHGDCWHQSLSGPAIVQMTNRHMKSMNAGFQQRAKFVSFNICSSVNMRCNFHRKAQELKIDVGADW